ncbi:MAG TPA: hypothetical protein VH350_12165 [Candidatus Sulfotelmatobacter sp.]|nr:hypothetical protein [Candidatus Sulfotelmatobacter sp.]
MLGTDADHWLSLFLGLLPGIVHGIQAVVGDKASGATEILVEAAKPLRANPGPEEHVLVNEFNHQMLKLFAAIQA